MTSNVSIDIKAQEKALTTELASKAANGDVAAFEKLYKAKAKKLLYHAYTILGNYHDAEDAAQAVVIRMHKNIHGLRDPGAFDTWMYKITQNICYRMADKKNKRFEDFTEESEEQYDFAETRADMLPVAYVENEELFEELKRVIGELPPRRKQAFMMFYLEGLSYKQIADVMELSVSTVSTSIVRGREKIKTEMDKYLDQNDIKTKQDKTAVVLGAAFVKMADQTFPADRMDAFFAKCDGAIAHTNTSMVKKAASQGGTKILIGAILSVVVIASGVGFAISHISETTPPPASSPSQEVTEVYRSGDIGFISEDCDCGHVNPLEANADDVDFDYSSVTWSITKADSEEVLFSGEGDKITTPFAELKDSSADGNYVLSYKFLNADDKPIFIMEREFVIDTGDIPEGKYL